MAVPMVFEDEVLGLLLMDDASRSREFSDREAEVAGNFAQLAAANVSQARLRLSLRAGLDASRRHLAAERRAAAASKSLSELVGRGRSQADLLEGLAEILGKPCALFGNDGRRGPVGLPAGGDAAAVPACLGPDVAALAAASPGARPDPGGEDAIVVGPLPAAGLPRRALVVSLALGPERWGHLAVIEDGPRLGATDLAVARRAATIIALKGRLDHTAEEGARDSRSLLAMDLMRGTAEPGGVQRRAGRLGLGLDARRAVLAVSSRDPAGSPPDPRRLGAALREMLPEAEVDAAALGDAAAALIEVPRGDDPDAFAAIRREELAALCARLGREDLVAGLSAAHRWVDGYRTAREEAMRVLACLRRFSPPGGPVLLTVEDLGGTGLLLAGTAGDEIVRFAEETVGLLVDDGTSVDLVATLCAFFAKGCGIRGTATELGVHENTVRYRLGRVEELTGLPVSREPDAQLSAHLGLVVMRLQGRLPAGISPAGARVVETD
jgi:sugar diacid utilization regulator